MLLGFRLLSCDRRARSINWSNPKCSLFKTFAEFGRLNSAIGARHAMNKQNIMLGRRYALPDSMCLVKLSAK
jgi:hypothetical protein